jgi:hypothetical protein
MNDNLIELANVIFKDPIKDPFSVQIELTEFNSQEDLFEVLLHLFIYGYKLKKLNINNITDLKPYFRCIGVNLNIEIIPYSELDFLINEKYLTRYCNISEHTFEDYELNNVKFILSRNFKETTKIENMYACYVHEINNNFDESFISFISFDFKFTS